MCVCVNYARLCLSEFLLPIKLFLTHSLTAFLQLLICFFFFQEWLFKEYAQFCVTAICKKNLGNDLNKSIISKIMSQYRLRSLASLKWTEVRTCATWTVISSERQCRSTQIMSPKKNNWSLKTAKRTDIVILRRLLMMILKKIRSRKKTLTPSKWVKLKTIALKGLET